MKLTYFDTVCTDTMVWESTRTSSTSMLDDRLTITTWLVLDIMTYFNTVCTDTMVWESNKTSSTSMHNNHMVGLGYNDLL